MCYYWGISTNTTSYNYQESKISRLELEVKRLQADVEKWKQRLAGALMSASTAATANLDDAELDDVLREIGEYFI